MVDLQFFIPGIQRTEEGVVVVEEEEDGTETGMEAVEGTGDIKRIAMVTDGMGQDTGTEGTGGIGIGDLETNGEFLKI